MTNQPISDLPLDNGKYVIHREDNRTTVTRNGEAWQDLTGDNLIYWLLTSHDDLENKLIDIMNVMDSDLMLEVKLDQIKQLLQHNK